MSTASNQQAALFGSSSADNDPENRQKMRRAIIQLVGINIIAPVVINLVVMRFAPPIVSMALSGVPSLLAALYRIVIHRQLDIIAAFVVVSIAISITVVALNTDPRWLLLKDSIEHFVLGLVFIVSIWFKQNLLWRYNVQWRGTDPAALERLKTMWETRPAIRKVTNVMSLVYGIGFCVEAAIRVGLIFVLPTNVMSIVSPLLGLGFLILAAVWTRHFIRRLREKYHNGQLAAPTQAQPVAAAAAVVVPSQQQPPAAGVEVAPSQGA
ncbi:uncharacterized protein BJ171DRAFT_625855 [Polychytrium aggregatum]|uniref:uncharacterized protein n=1 Tax=Polychytrium aggregatum TaxID=110093 RepID=UPI0022FDF28D|nr:uncharacterized protein BJ171DRAFT_625855 [Polychytrium aggregatum]KAI9202817.1 hypothetical protein BJ171DRAFT_625855 [Polychytrium aggregatum]